MGDPRLNADRVSERVTTNEPTSLVQDLLLDTAASWFSSKRMVESSANGRSRLEDVQAHNEP